jgi:hypothetical protein
MLNDPKVRKVEKLNRKCDDETFVRVWETYAHKGRRAIANALGMAVVSVNARYKKLTACGVRLSEPVRIRHLVDVKKLNQLAEQTRQFVHVQAPSQTGVPLPQKSRVVVAEAVKPPVPRQRITSALEPISEEV